MKKAILIIAAVVLLASCSQYTCPTYSKAAPKKVENKI
jgi:PBP1b-binding outer membrane lipoprotein LpoB